MEGAGLISEGQAGVKGAEAGKRAALIGVKEAPGSGETQQSARHDRFHDFGYCFKKKNDMEGGRGVGGCLSGFVEDETICFLQGQGVIPERHNGG